MLSLPFIVACVMIVIENMFLNPTEKPVHPTSDGVLDSETADPQRRPSHPTPPVCKGRYPPVTVIVDTYAKETAPGLSFVLFLVCCCCLFCFFTSLLNRSYRMLIFQCYGAGAGAAEIIKSRSRSRNDLFNKFLLRSVWMLEWRKCYGFMFNSSRYYYLSHLNVC